MITAMIIRNSDDNNSNHNNIRRRGADHPTFMGEGLKQKQINKNKKKTKTHKQ